MKHFIKEQFYSNKQKTILPPNSEKDCHATALSEVLFENLYPIDQFFILLSNDETDEDDFERAIHILRSMFEKLSNDLWKLDSEVTKHLGEILVYRPRAGWETEQRGVDPIGAKIYRSWCAEDDGEDQDSEKVTVEEASGQYLELLMGE